MASILTTLFYMAVILALTSLVLPAKFYGARQRSRKQSFLIWLGVSLLLFIGISFFAPSLPLQETEPALKATQVPVPEISQKGLPEEARSQTGEENGNGGGPGRFGEE